jgi:alpha-N-arabinofuranosidase
MGLSLLARADRVKIACLAQLVNVIAPIMTEPGGPAWRQTIFWPFRDLSWHGRGNVLRPAMREVEKMSQQPSDQPAAALQTVAVARDDGGITLFSLNRAGRHQDLRVELRGDGVPRRLEEWRCLAGGDLTLANTAAHPDTVRPRSQIGAAYSSQILEASLPPFSWNVFSFKR